MYVCLNGISGNKEGRCQPLYVYFDLMEISSFVFSPAFSISLRSMSLDIS